MALIRDLSSAQLAFQISGGTADQFVVVRYRGTEGLCQLYRFEIDLSTTEQQVAFDDIVGKAAVLSVNTEKGTRWFHGIVSRFELTGESPGRMQFRAELVPALWTLTHRYNSRIFQNQTVKDILTAVLTQAGIASDRVRLDLTGTYEPRIYCVQYRETDYNFISRLMEHEGIWWFFEQTADAHTFVATDITEGYPPIDGESANLRYQSPTGLATEEEHVVRFRMGQAVRPGAVVLRDFDFENPKLDLQAKADAGRDAGFEFSDYPGIYVSQARGSALAKIRAEEFEAHRTRGVGQSNSYRLAPGRTFDLTEHPSTPLNGKYLVTSVTHQGKSAITSTTGNTGGRGSLLDGSLHQSILAASQDQNTHVSELAKGLLQIASRLQVGDPTAHRALTDWLYHAGQVSRDLPSTASASGGNPLDALVIPNLIDDLAGLNLTDFATPVYECRFECIPAAVAYRPPRVAPWPVMRGTQTARVVGPSGEEIHTDEYGRVKVQFNWDREGKFDENASCWIRVNQGFAGGQYGILFLPRIGQEVVVDFLEGDPDQPLIVGRVYNKDHMPPYKLPDEKTKSVIKTRTTKDGGGSHEIRFEDLKDSEQMLLYGQKDLHIRFKNDRVETIENSRHLTVGHDRIEEVKKNYHLKVEEENLNIEVTQGDQSLKVGGKVSIAVAGTHSTKIDGDVVEKFGMNHKNEVAMTSVTKALSIKLEASTGIELKCGGSSIVLTPAAIFIVGGPLVNINSGSGPPVGPVSASVTPPEAPEAPAEADTVEHGKDTTYGGGEAPEPAETPADVAGLEFERTEVEKKEPSWVSIELVDEADQPRAGERYEITLPDGTVKKGSLDANGTAWVSLPEAMDVQVSFPELDAAAWEAI